MAIQAVQVTPVTVSVETSCCQLVSGPQTLPPPSLYYMYMIDLEKDKAKSKAVLLPWVGFKPRLPRQLSRLRSIQSRANIST